VYCGGGYCWGAVPATVGALAEGIEIVSPVLAGGADETFSTGADEVFSAGADETFSASVSTRAPQFGQNGAPSTNGVPHTLQFIEACL
jgi:hypothetical protein